MSLATIFATYSLMEMIEALIMGHGRNEFPFGTYTGDSSFVFGSCVLNSNNKAYQVKQCNDPDSYHGMKWMVLNVNDNTFAVSNSDYLVYCDDFRPSSEAYRTLWNNFHVKSIKDVK